MTSVHIHMLMVTFLIQIIAGKQENHCLAPGDLQVTQGDLWMLLLPQRCVHPVHVCLDEKAAPRIPGVCFPARSSKSSPFSFSCPGPSSMHCEFIPHAQHREALPGSSIYPRHSARHHVRFSGQTPKTSFRKPQN